MSADQDGGGLTAEERAEHGRRADTSPAAQLVYSLTDVELLLRRRVAAAEQRGADRVTTAIEALADEWQREADGLEASLMPKYEEAAALRRCAATVRAALADPAPRQYDDAGPALRAMVERAERDAEVAARAWDEGWDARAEYSDRRDVPVGWPDLNPYRAAALEGGDQP